MNYYVRFRYPINHPEIRNIHRDMYLAKIKESGGIVYSQFDEAHVMDVPREFNTYQIEFECNTRPDWMPSE